MADYRSIICQRSTANTPAILTPTTGDTVLVANTARCAWSIQNLDTYILYVKFGAGATDTDFNIALIAGSGADNGTGGVYSQEEGVIYTGIVSVAGTTPRCVVTEI